MKRILLMLALTGSVLMVNGQQHDVSVTGSIQSDMLLSTQSHGNDAADNGDFMSNTYVDLVLQSHYVDAGTRMEHMEHPLPGYDSDFKGWGLPHFWVKGKLDKVELTAGTFYEQFGSGFILRSYEERSLGIDNSLLGARIAVKPMSGITIKALTGKHRHYWKWDGGLVSGADAEVNLGEMLSPAFPHPIPLTIGASWVNKYEKDEDIFTDPTHRLNLPKYVNAWDVRASLNSGPWGILVEYAQKTQDPSFDNNYSYADGHVAMLSSSYSKKGFSILLQAKRSENMAFRSQRSCLGASMFINHMPTFTLDHTYTLAALYPYATQLAAGEWAYQAEIGYNFKRKTALGGKYGTNLKVNYSYVRAIQDAWLKWGDATYYQDLCLQMSRRLTHNVKLNLMYMNQHFNKTVVEGEGGMIHANIFVADALFQLAHSTKLRTELQYLTTRQDLHDYVFALAELSLAPHWMFTLSDAWNHGGTKDHYYQGLVTYNVGSHRLQAGYGRTEAGYNCSGGVCRYVPETKGFTLSYNYNF